MPFFFFLNQDKQASFPFTFLSSGIGKVECIGCRFFRDFFENLTYAPFSQKYVYTQFCTQIEGYSHLVKILWLSKFWGDISSPFQKQDSHLLSWILKTRAKPHPAWMVSFRSSPSGPETQGGDTVPVFPYPCCFWGWGTQWGRKVLRQFWACLKCQPCGKSGVCIGESGDYRGNFALLIRSANFCL